MIRGIHEMSKETRTRTSRTGAFEVTDPIDISKLKHKLCPICLSEDVDIRAERTDRVVSDERRPVKFLLPVVDCHACERNSRAIESYAYIHDLHAPGIRAFDRTSPDDAVHQRPFRLDSVASDRAAERRG